MRSNGVRGEGQGERGYGVRGDRQRIGGARFRGTLSGGGGARFRGTRGGSRVRTVLNWARRLLAALVVALLSTPMAAHAHGLLLDADTDGAVITGRVYYTNGDIAVREPIALLDLATPAATPIPAKTDDDGRFSYPVIAGHRYRVSAYGEEGHSVDVEIDAIAKARPTLVETETSAKEDSSLPPAWAVIGGLLVLSLAPIAVRRLKRAPA